MMKKLLLLLLCCVLLLTACAFASAEVSLTSINVGKADCHLLTLGEQVFMIDTAILYNAYGQEVSKLE